MRASDADRQRTVDELRRHCAAGRIDVDEYASRIERALAAATLEELDEIRADLPMIRIAEPVGRSGPVPALARSGLGGQDDQPGRAPVGVRGRVLALAVAVLSVAVVLSAIALSFAAEWLWAAAVLVAWAVGLVQGRLARRGRPA